MARPSKRDPQQYKVYAMEKEFEGPSCGRLSRKAVVVLCNLVCDTYKVERATVQFKNLKGWSATCRADGRLVFGVKKTSRLVGTVLHELAHHIHNQLGGDKGTWEDQAHGPEFMACYISLLDRARVIPVVAMRALCRDRGVKYLDPGRVCSVRKLRRLIS